MTVEAATTCLKGYFILFSGLLGIEKKEQDVAGSFESLFGTTPSE